MCHKGGKYVTNSLTNISKRVSDDYVLQENEFFGSSVAGKLIRENKGYCDPVTKEIKCFPENEQPVGRIAGRGKKEIGSS